MTTTNVTIRGIDKQAYFRLKALAAESGASIAHVVEEAITCLLKHRKAGVRNPRSFMKLKPVNWGPGSENASQEIDEVLYGARQ